MVIIVSKFSSSIGGRGRSIYMGDIVNRAIIPDFFRIFYVEMLMDGVVEFGRVGSGADMEKEFNAYLLQLILLSSRLKSSTNIRLLYPR